MITRNRLGCAIAIGLAISVQAATGPAPTLSFDRPAQKWAAEALPLGNGRLGCMIFGGVERERIQFNESSLWTGDRNPSGKYETMGAYQNFGDVLIEFSGAAQPGVSAGSDHKPYYESEAIEFSADGRADTKWCVEHHGRPVVWQRTMPAQAVLTNYSFTACQDMPERDPRTWTLEGSANGQAWTILDRRENQAPFARRGETKSFAFANAAPFQHYRLTFVPNQAVPHFQVAEISLGAGGSAATSGAVPDYRRELNLAEAIHRVSYAKGGTTFAREAFASFPDEVMVFQFRASSAGAYSGTIQLKGAHKEATAAAGGDLQFDGKFDNGLQYQARLRVQARGGSILATNGALRFDKCDQLTLFLAAGTSYVMDDAKDWKGEPPGQRLAAQLTAAAGRSFEQLKQRHVADFQAIYGRVALDLGATPAAQRAKPTPQRLADYAKGGQDPELEALMFQYGRYLLISCSRTNGLPANLQGLWNDSNNPAWHCDYHSNINIQMNYWLAEPANLAECHRPFLDLVLAMREPSRAATRAAFGPGRGWTARTSHNIFGGHGWEWNIPASAWYAQHFWEHYAFSLDQEYLRQEAYPLLKEICEYWEDHLKALPDGSLVVPKGWSPEHGPREDGVAHDQQIVWDLFSNYLLAAGALKVDAEYATKIAGLRDRLVGPKIGRWGQLQEWIADRDDPKDQHRHTSHLFAVYPGVQISMAKTPEFAKAAAISLAARGEAGDSRRSWTWPWRCALWARLDNPENARRMVRGLLTYNVTDNLFGNHPPFQMDGNFGITAGMCEMLLQSHAGELSVLPALPADWPTGAFRGLRGRGGFEVDAAWQAGRLAEAKVLSLRGQPVRLRTPVPVKSVKTAEGKAVAIQREGAVIRFATQPGQRYQIGF